MADQKEEEFLEESSSDENEELSKDNFMRCVYVGNISYKATEADLRKFFSVAGEISDLKFPIHKDHKGTAFITFSNVDGASEAADLSGAEMLGRKMNVRFRHKGHLSKKPKNCRIVFLNNLDFKASPADIKSHFEDCGEVVDVRIPTTARGFKFGTAYVEFVDTNCVDEAMLKNGSTFMGRELGVNWALPDKAEKSRKRLQESHTLHMGNLPFNYSAKTIREWFANQGVDAEKCQIRLQKRPDGKFKGQAFVDFEDTADFFKILKLNDTIQGGRRVNISVSLPKENRKRKLEQQGEGPRKKTKTWLEKISETRVLKSFIIHGAPRAMEFDEISNRFSKYSCESFTRQKGSVMVTFPSREQMGRALESVNGATEFNGNFSKIAPAGEHTKQHPVVTVRGIPKNVALADIRKEIEKQFEIETSFCYRIKKRVVCECKDGESQRKLIESRNVEIAGKRVEIAKS